MKNRNDKHENRVKKLAIGCGLCGVILVASTYAWFIGMKTVNVSSFDVSIAAIDSLELSLDGKTWGDTVNISEENYKTVNTSNNTNSWGGKGLIPMSTVGIINTGASRLTLYEKGSFTQAPGGYRVMATEVKNTGDAEADGYVAFDLFIKNLSGNEYYTDLNKLNEEAIYMTPQSAVTVSDAGGKEGTGIENSVRVGFAQIGRVKATTTDQATITGITCATAGNVTGICADRPAQIWEPNDTKHVQNAINWYNTTCRPRTGETVTDNASYDMAKGDDGNYTNSCSEVKDGEAYETYAISGRIDYGDNINVYDGTDYNGYGTSVATTATKGKLVSYPYFTDSMKDLKGVNRPELLTLAPNSITKVRIYIWIEGQDVDNYDFASLGKQISVAFGFTKEQLYGEDIDYNGDDVDPKGPNLPAEVDKRPTTTVTP